LFLKPSSELKHADTKALFGMAAKLLKILLKCNFSKKYKMAIYASSNDFFVKVGF
jgi:hypothetical protein